MKLTLNQNAAVNEIYNNLQIIACAGSGKTEVITRRIVNILEKTDTLPENIVAFTFTEKAAESMKKRITKALIEENYSDIDQINKMYIGTIHGYCLKILREYCKDFKNFKVLDSVKSYLYIKKNFDICGVRDLGLSFYESDIKLFENCIEKLIYDFDNNYLWEDNNLQVFNKFKNLLYKDKYLTFQFLIFETIYQMNNNDELNKRLLDIKYLIVDEYQDVDDLQEMIVRKFYDLKTNICVVADDDQTIYRFRGSNSDNMISFNQRYDNVVQIKLEENFRSTSKIVDFASSIICNNRNRLDKTMFSSNINDSILEGVCLSNKEEEYSDIVKKIKNLVLNGEKYSDIAILVRKNKYINDITKIFNDNDIPYETNSAEYFFKGLYFQCFSETLRILTDIDKAKIYNCWKDYIDSDYINAGFRYLRKVARTGGNRSVIKLTDIILNFIKETDFLNEKYVDVDIRRNDVDCLYKILEDYDEIYKDFQLSARVNGVLKFLEEEAAEQYKYYDFNIQISDSVKIMSIHKSKGLEFNDVFIIGLESGEFPAKRFGGRTYWNVLGHHFEVNKGKYDGDIEDERKLFYVAITRAKKNLYLYSQISERRISSFLEEAMNFKELYIDNNSLSNIEGFKEDDCNLYNKEDITVIRNKVLDYYATVSHFYKGSCGDFERCLEMNNEDILEEAKKLKII